jgi:uncharacterized membrane protein YbhN (UPF0104 family)
MVSLSSRTQTVLKGLLAVALLAALVVGVEWTTVATLFAQASWVWAAAALALLPANVGLDAWVWGVLLRPIHGRVSFRSLLAAVLSGFAVGFFTPGRIGEYAGRTFHLQDGDGWTISASIAVQRAADMAAAVGVGVVGIGTAVSTGVVPASTTWIGLLGVGIVVSLSLTGLVLFPAAVDALGRRLAPSVDGLHRRTAFLTRLTRRDRALVGAGTLLRYGVFALQLALLARAFVPDADVAALAGAVTTTYFGAFLLPPVTLMDLGIREGAAVFFFGAWGIGGGVGLNASLLVFVLNIVLPSALGLPFLRSLQLRATGSAPTEAPSDRDASDRDASDRDASDRDASDRDASDRDASDRDASDRDASDRDASDGNSSDGGSSGEASSGGAYSGASAAAPPIPEDPSAAAPARRRSPCPTASTDPPG